MKITHTASREEWLAARLDLLVKEKAASRQFAALAEERRALGADVMLSTYRFLDLTLRGRQHYINDWPWHDTYGTPDRHEHHH